MEFYQGKRACGNSYNAALRALGNRWLEVLWHRLHKGVRYDEAVHTANRNPLSCSVRNTSAAPGSSCVPLRNTDG